MVKQIQFVRWKPVRCKNVNNEYFMARLPHIVDTHGVLLSDILAMPKKRPLDLETAFNLLDQKQSEAFSAGQFGREPGQFFWYYENFVKFISDLGYHIELTGDEFEASVITDKLA